MAIHLKLFLVSGVIFLSPFCLFVSAQEFTSDSYTVTAPVLFPGGYSTSTSFTLNGVISQMAIGTSTTGSLYQLFGGFLYFPFVSTPVVIATAGDGQVSLSWTSSDASTGWAVGGYSVGQSTVTNGPYTYTGVGDVLASTRTGLANGTTYYFVILPEDALGNRIATSSEVSAVPVASLPPLAGSGSGSGSGVGTTGVNFSGRAYPSTNVTLLKDGQIAVATVAGPDAHFQISLTNLSAGNYTFSIYGTDKDGLRSLPVTFSVTLTLGASTNITGIFLSPTISVDKREVRRGDNIAIFGQSAASSSITIVVNSDEEHFGKVESDKGGVYLYNLDTFLLEYGEHSARSKATVVNEISNFSNSVAFKVGTENVLALGPSKCPVKGDLNGDCRVNLIDFSVAAYWYKRPLSNAFKMVEEEKLSGDATVDLVDFSIMAFYWTG